MFRKQKSNKQLSPSDAIEFALRQINNIINATDRIAGRAETTTLLVNVLSERRYCDAVGGRSSYHLSTTVCPPSSPSTFSELKSLITGK
jgi:hypothetical protein